MKQETTTTLIIADCRAAMRAMDENSIDCIITDPPYGLGLMGKGWDQTVPGIDFWQEAIRVIKPGGYCLAFSSPRTFHRLAVVMEDAGLELRDTVSWLYSSGMAKGPDVGKKAKGTTWNGYRTGLKPAWEPILVFRKSFKGPVFSNCEKWGVGAFNIDACRIPFAEGESSPTAQRRNAARKSGVVSMQDRCLGVELASEANAMGRFGRRGDASTYMEAREAEDLGRFPANLILDEESSYVAGDQARCFFISKASLSEREAGTTPDPRSTLPKPRGNTHPTVKPIDLMRWLVRLAAPVGGTILDPFAGSGTTGIAAVLEGMNFVGCELDPHYADIARARIDHWSKTTD